MEVMACFYGPRDFVFDFLYGVGWILARLFFLGLFGPFMTSGMAHIKCDWIGMVGRRYQTAYLTWDK